MFSSILAFVNGMLMGVRAHSFMKNVYTVFSVDDNGVGFAPLA